VNDTAAAAATVTVIQCSHGDLSPLLVSVSSDVAVVDDDTTIKRIKFRCFRPGN